MCRRGKVYPLGVFLSARTERNQRCAGATSRRGGFGYGGPNSMAQTRRPRKERQAPTTARQGPVAREERYTPLRVCPPEGTSHRRGPPKTAFWFLCRREQRNPPPERRNSPRCVLSKDGKNQRSPGAGSEERQRSSRLPPDPVTGDAFLKPFRESGAGGDRIVSASPPLPLARQSKKAVRLDEESAPVATSHRGWAVIAGGWYPPLPQPLAHRAQKFSIPK